jgi:choline dehydrogenase-like flavoprotein
MENRTYEFVIVGSGAGGATLAKELTKRGRDVLVVEKGKQENKLGTVRGSLRYFYVRKLLRTLVTPKRRAVLARTFMPGGSTVVAFANGFRCLEQELGNLGINLEVEFAEAEQELGVAPIPERLLSEGSKEILRASRELGYKMELMPKFIDPSKCRKCGRCILGCPNGAKWTAQKYLDEAIQSGAQVLYDTSVKRVAIENGKAKSIAVKGALGKREISANTIILAAGGLGTPAILQQSGIQKAGSGLFVDLLVNTYGVTDGVNQLHEPAMSLVDHEFHKDKGFILSSNVLHPRTVNVFELGVRRGLTLPVNKLIGIMTKIVDEPAGQVRASGKVSKPITESDRARLDEGSSISKEILIKAGAREKSIVVTRAMGAHPGGTAAIGRIVDKDLQTEIDSLSVCDGSVLPTAPGLPPIMTIIALAKRLAKTLAP